MDEQARSSGILAALFDLSPDIRYADAALGQKVVTRQRHGLSGASSSESDRYEELLVNPVLVVLARQRGDIDCGGLRFHIVRYGNFFQIVVPWASGHISVAVEPGADPVDLAERILRLLSRTTP